MPNITPEMIEAFQARYRELSMSLNWGPSWPDAETSANLLSAALSVEAGAAPVGRQWCAYADGGQYTSWYPENDSYRPDWEALAEQYPDQYRIVWRDLYAHTAPAPAVEGWRPVVDAARTLLKHWEEFKASDANFEQAYYKLAKYAWNDWVALHNALVDLDAAPAAPTPQTEGGENG